MARCRSCEAEIIWASTVTGKAMPIDAAPSESGNLVYGNGAVSTASDEDRRLHRPRYTSHFATCPDAPRFRKAR